MLVCFSIRGGCTGWATKAAAPGSPQGAGGFGSAAATFADVFQEDVAQSGVGEDECSMTDLMDLRQ